LYIFGFTFNDFGIRLLNQLQALNKWLANRLITAITELAYRT